MPDTRDELAEARAEAWDECWDAAALYIEARERTGDATFPTNPYRDACSHCSPGCKSCWPPDCECYTHQDEPDRRLFHRTSGQSPDHGGNDD